MLVSGSFAKIVGAGLLLKVSRSFVSDEGREGGAGEGGAERRAPPLELPLFVPAWFSLFELDFCRNSGRTGRRTGNSTCTCVCKRSTYFSFFMYMYNYDLRKRLSSYHLGRISINPIQITDNHQASYS